MKHFDFFIVIIINKLKENEKVFCFMPFIHH